MSTIEPPAQHQCQLPDPYTVPRRAVHICECGKGYVRWSGHDPDYWGEIPDWGRRPRWWLWLTKPHYRRRRKP